MQLPFYSKLFSTLIWQFYVTQKPFLLINNSKQPLYVFLLWELISIYIIIPFSFKFSTELMILFLNAFFIIFMKRIYNIYRYRYTTFIKHFEIIEQKPSVLLQLKDPKRWQAFLVRLFVYIQPSYLVKAEASFNKQTFRNF